MRSLSRLLAVAALTLAAAPAVAVTLDDLYEASVEVAGKGADARSEGFRRALEEVLIRVSGSSAVLSNPDIEGLLEAPERFVQQYRYEPLEQEDDDDGAAAADADNANGADDADAPGAGDAGTIAAAAAGEDREPTHRLEVSFTGARIDDALRERGVIVWGRQRPEVLVWLAVDDGRERYIIGADGGSRPHRALMAQSRERGLPVLLPLLDVADRSELEFVDISGGFLDAVERASDRYRAEAVLVGHLQRGGGGWQADWNLLGVGERRTWSARARALDDAVASGVHGATDRLAAALAGRTGERTALRVRVQAVDSLDDYARVGNYLESLVRVRSANVARVRPGEAVFAVDLQGRPEDLERTIALGNTLVAVEWPEEGVRVPVGADGAPASEGDGAAAEADGEAAWATAAGTSPDAVDGDAAVPGAAGAAAGPGAGDAPVELVFRLSG